MRTMLLAMLSVLATSGTAAVRQADPAGFLIESRIAVPATPTAAFAALVDVGRWWDGAHSYSGDPANLSIAPVAGGCFCERLPAGGSVEHGRVIQAVPGRTLRLAAALGPLQREAVTGVLDWTITAAPGGGSVIVQRYAVGGHVPGGLASLAPVVDGVLTAQLARLGERLSRQPPR